MTSNQLRVAVSKVLAVVFDAAGNLYGTAYDGWGTGCCGVVFEFTK